MAITASKSVNLYTKAYPSSLPYVLSVSFEETATSTTNNTSTISIKGSIKSTGQSWDSNYDCCLKIYWYDNNTGEEKLINTSETFQDLSKNASKSVTGSITVTHKNDGTLSGYAKAFFDAGSTFNYIPVDTSVATSTTALTKIPRQSSFGTVTGSVIGSEITIKINRNSDSFTHSLWYSFGDLTWQGIASGVETSKTFTPPLNLCSQIPNATSGTLKLILRTYNGSTQIGSDVTKSITVSVPSSVVPTMGKPTATLIDNTADKLGVYCQNYSKTKISIVDAAGAYGSTIKAYKITGAGYSSSESTLTTGILNTSGKLTFTCTITDSRGRYFTDTVEITVYAYTTPTLSITAKRCNSDGSINSGGTYVLITPVYEIASVNGKNGVKSGPTATGNNNTKTGSSSGTSFILGSEEYPFKVTDTYRITVTITDKVGGTTPKYADIPTDIRTINIKKSGKGIAFGGFATEENVIKSYWDLKVEGNVYSSTGTISQSDRNKKKDFVNFDERYESLFMELKPQLFRFVDGSSGRLHSGFVSQDVEQSLINNGLSALDFAGFCKDKSFYTYEDNKGIVRRSRKVDVNGNQIYDYSLRYEEFIAMNTHMIQKCWNKINELVDRR